MPSLSQLVASPSSVFLLASRSHLTLHPSRSSNGSGSSSFSLCVPFTGSRSLTSFCSSRSPPSSSSSSSPSSSGNLDNNGAIQDMESYLNDLSLEYDSVWDTKPAWCQPWTIVLTGCIGVLISWLPLHSVSFTSLVAAAVAVWWFIFLYSYPQAYEDMIAERRKQVQEGNEDTYGSQRW